MSERLTDGEVCFWHRFGGGEPCRKQAVGPRLPKLGNWTDDWVWCEEHGGVRPRGPDTKAIEERAKETEKP